MIKQYATVDWDKDAQAFCSGKYPINDKIYIQFPTIRQVMFDYGEKRYWSVMYSLIATSSDLIAQLDTMGLDWEKVSDFEVFLRNFIFLPEEDIHIFLPTVSPKDFILCENSDTQELMLYNEKDNITIDKFIHENIADYIRYAHGIKKNVIRAGNEFTHRDIIEDAHDEIKRQQRRQKKQKSQMKTYISFLANTYKCLPDQILDMKVNYFFDAIKRINAINEATTMPFLMYYGMVDGSKRENQKRLDPMRDDV